MTLTGQQPPADVQEFDAVLMSAYRLVLSLAEFNHDLPREKAIILGDDLRSTLDHLRYARWGAMGRFPPRKLPCEQLGSRANGGPERTGDHADSIPEGNGEDERLR